MLTRAAALKPAALGAAAAASLARPTSHPARPSAAKKAGDEAAPTAHRHRRPSVAAAASAKKNGGGGEAAPPAHPSQHKEHADAPPPAKGTHAGTTLEFYASPGEAASPYLEDVRSAERHEKGARLARAHWSAASEAALNEQIGREWALSYTYEAMASAFSEADRALPGAAAYFRAQAEGERGHARKLMALQATRGGSTQLPALAAPDDFVASAHGGPDLGPLARGGRGRAGQAGGGTAGDAIRAFEAALALERLNYTALEHLHAVAEQEGDAQFMDAVEDMLADQAAEVKAAADYVSQVVRAGPGLGEFLFDQALARGGGSLAVF